MSWIASNPFLVSVPAIAACWGLLAPMSAQPERSERLTGVVYGRLTSPSGRGVESVFIATPAKVQEFVYSKPLKSEFASPSCEDVGAIWTIDVLRDGSTGGKLLRAFCDGKTDLNVTAAAQQIRRYLDALLRREYSAAYWLFTPEWKRLHTSAAFVDYAQELQFRSGITSDWAVRWCLQVQEPATPKSIRFTLGLDCEPKYRGEMFRAISLDLTRPKGEKAWHIANVYPGPM